MTYREVVHTPPLRGEWEVEPAVTQLVVHTTASVFAASEQVHGYMTTPARLDALGMVAAEVERAAGNTGGRTTADKPDRVASTDGFAIGSRM